MAQAGYMRASYPPPGMEVSAYAMPAPMYPQYPYFPPYADPPPDFWRGNAQLARRPLPINVDPPPDDIRFRLDRFRDYLAGIFRDAGVNPEAMQTATVNDLVEAFKTAQMPAAARTTATTTIAHVASLDATGLERMRLQLESERHHLEALSKAVEERQRATKGEARK